MTSLHLTSALLPDGWQDDVRLEFGEDRIVAITSGEAPRPGDACHAVGIPGMSNLHSHAFQRAMAGRAETRSGSGNSFWSWRELMYRFALTMTPEDLEAVASQLYAEMLEAGFTRVGEFHYLHHDHDGRPYAAIAEMAERIMAAAQRSGIGLTLLPVFYAHANFGGAPPSDEQRRFVNNLDRFACLLDATRTAAKRIPGTIVGLAPHSLRAVTAEELRAVTELAGESPIHIHAAEQIREVEDSIAWSGARPVGWLLENSEVDARWCLIHATHMSEAETADLARSGAVAGLCPITEANLGDGTFNAVPFLAAGGRFGIGSDSNVEISAAAELRQLEYAQRLHHNARNVLAGGIGSTGRALFEVASRGGAAALGGASGFRVGGPADIVILDGNHPSYPHLASDGWLDSWIFSAGNALVESVWVGGKKLVQGGRHRAHAAIAERYRWALRRLAA